MKSKEALIEILNYFMANPDINGVRVDYGKLSVSLSRDTPERGHTHAIGFCDREPDTEEPEEETEDKLPLRLRGKIKR